MMPLGILVEDVGYNFYIRERESLEEPLDVMRRAQ